MVLNTETWYLNLTAANSDSAEPVWERVYDAKSAYNMPSLLPQEWYNFVTKSATDDQLFDKYYR